MVPRRPNVGTSYLAWAKSMLCLALLCGPASASAQVLLSTGTNSGLRLWGPNVADWWLDPLQNQLDIRVNGSTTPWLSILPGGNVGIGTTSPSVKLHVISEARNLLRIESTDETANAGPYLGLYRNSASPAAGDSTGAIQFVIKDSAGNLQETSRIGEVLIDPTDGSEASILAFFTAGAGTRWERVRIDNNGNVGIGTTNPTSALTVLNGDIRITTNTGGSYGLIFPDGTKQTSAAGTSAWATSSSGTAISGNIGIGTTAPAGNLEVVALSGVGSYTADLTTGGTAISGGDYSGYPASGAFDNLFPPPIANEWSPSQTDSGMIGNYIGYDFGAGINRHIRRVRIIFQDAIHAQKGMHAEYSDNGSVWTLVQAIVPAQSPDWQTFDLVASGAHRYWRLELTDVPYAASYGGINEVEMMEAASIVNESAFLVSGSGRVGIGTSNPTVQLERSCPGGFTNVKSGNNQLGCMQDSENASASWVNAANYCFVVYGGRLPSNSEWYAFANNYSFTRTGNREWLDAPMWHSSYGLLYAIASDTDMANINGESPAGPRVYRCWIPR